LSDEVILENVTFTYEDGSRPAVSDLSLNVQKGETVVIAGPAGAGKSTVCRMLNGLIPHFFRGVLKGKILVKGYETRNYPISFLAHQAGVLFDDPSSQLICPTVEEEISFGLENYGVPREEMIERVHNSIRDFRLTGYEQRNPHTLSGGEQQLCALASVIAMRPDVLILDEPTSRLDPIGSHQVYNIIKDLSMSRAYTIILVDNKIEEIVELADRLLILKDGRLIAEGPPRQVLQKESIMKEAGIRPPQVTELFFRIKESPQLGAKLGSEPPITLAEGERQIGSMFNPKIKSRERIHQSDKRCEGDAIIDVKDLWHIYPNGFAAVKGVSLQVAKGEFIGIIGQNGSGKTTLVKHFNGLLKPSRGAVIVDGIDTRTTTTSFLSRKVGLVFQNPDHQLFARSVLKEIEFGPRNLGVPEEEIKERVRESLEAVKLPESILNAQPTSLSTAQKQRVNIASVLAMRTSILVVDEPTTGQDPQMRREIMELMTELNKRGTTVVVITHDMHLVAEYCQRGMVMKNGEVLLEGSTGELFSKPEILAEAYLKPPQITMLSQKLGGPQDILSVDEFFDWLKNEMSHR